MFSVTIIGSGNVGSNLFESFTSNNIIVDALWSRNIETANSINNTVATTNLDFSESNSTLFIISVPDNAITEILLSLKVPEDSIVVHTAGTTSISILSKFKNHGVFYPFQTFSKSKKLDFSTIPIIIEANNNHTFLKLKELASLISNKVIEANSERRKKIHLSAVFACNFTNHLLSISEDILSKEGLDFDFIEPLVKETIQKAFELGSKKAQTGPAVRQDNNTMEAHLSLLDDNKKELYKLLSSMIMKNS